MTTTSATTTTESAKPRRTFAHRLGMMGFLTAEAILRLISMKMLNRLGRGLGLLAWYLAKDRRNIVARNMRIVCGLSLRGKELVDLTKENFKRTVANFLCSAKTGTLSNEKLQKVITIINHDEFARPLKENRGRLCAIAHSGNWESLARIRVFYPEIERYGSMYRQMDNPILEEYIYKRRTESGTQMFSKEGGIKTPMKFLKEASALGVLSDQFTWEGVYVPFFGKVTGTTPLPALLRKRSNSDVVAIAVQQDGPGHWAVDMGVNIDFTDSDGTLMGDTLIVNRALEEVIKKSVCDEFWMHHRWKFVPFFDVFDDKTRKLLSGMKLTPFRLLISVPRALNEALLSLPLLRALKDVRPDMQISIICPSEQSGVWKTVPEVSYVLTRDTAEELSAALNADEFYNDGPLDMAVMLDDDLLACQALKSHGPLVFVGPENHPGVKKFRFKVRGAVLKDGPAAHRLNIYLQLARQMKLEVNNPEWFPQKKEAAPDAPVLIAPFSNLGPANEWGEEQWGQLVNALPQRPLLIALKQDAERASVLAEKLGLEHKIGAYEELIPVLDAASAAVAVDGDLPALCSYRGLPSVTLFSTRLPDVWRPLGKFNRTLYSHQCCTPCHLTECDRSEPCNRQITVADVLTALSEL